MVMSRFNEKFKENFEAQGRIILSKRKGGYHEKAEKGSRNNDNCHYGNFIRLASINRM